MIRAMAGSVGRGLQLDAEHAAFIQGPVSVVVSARDANLLPHVMRGCGCRVARNGRSVTVLVEPSRSGAMLDHIRSNGMVAVVFSQPSTHRTLQLKGADAQVGRAGRTDAATAQRHLAAWVADMQRIGYSAPFARAVRGEPAEIVAITFTPTAVFEQTPGPAAGRQLFG
jgi:hypothetical protein